MTKIYNFFLSIRLKFYLTFCKSKLNNKPTEMDKPGWLLSLYDDFTIFNSDLWRTDTYYGSRYHPGNIVNESKPPLMYLADDAVFIENGNLQLQNRKEITRVHYIDNGKDYGEWDIPYVSGQIDSSKLFEQKYGYFEIRSKIPNSLGTWPAFWLCSKYAWPPEIDVYETYTGKNMKAFESTIHWGINGQDSKGSDCETTNTDNLTQDFHVYGCEWTPKFIKIYYDGVLVKLFNDKKILDKWFVYPMHIIINNGVCDYDGQHLDQATFPNYHEIDYVKVYINSEQMWKNASELEKIDPFNEPIDKIIL